MLQHGSKFQNQNKNKFDLFHLSIRLVHFNMLPLVNISEAEKDINLSSIKLYSQVAKGLRRLS